MTKLFNIKINENTRTELIGLLTILVCIWLLFYFIPEIFATLFNSLLGNLILIIIVILVISYNMKYGVLIGCIFIILYRFSLFSRKKEGFSWSEDSTMDFLRIQDTIHRQKIFDVNMIQKNQASQEELNYFNKHGLWPWSQSTKDLFIQAITSNPYVKIAPDAALLETQSMYNETAILMALSYQTKEGQFLINGVRVAGSGSEEELPSGFGDFAYKSGLLEDKTKDLIRCNMNTYELERTHYTGKEGIYGSQTSVIKPVDYNNLEKIIPGFKFVKEPCNPCGALKEKPDYSCTFHLPPLGKVEPNPQFLQNM
jgi:hypothetical protein